MTATPPPSPEPERSALRPLSPYGEGYCRHCRFIIGLTPKGLIERHQRGTSLGDSADCKGSCTQPPKITPYASRKAAFKTVARKARCHECGREVLVMSDGRLVVHNSSAVARVLCAGGYSFPRPPGRDHGGERG